MEPKKFVSSNMAQALKQVKAEYGDDAIILNTKTLNDQVEIEALPFIPETAKVNEMQSQHAQFDEIILSKQISSISKEDEFIKKELASIKEMLKAKPYQERSLHPVIRQLTQKLELMGFGKDLVQYLLLDIDLTVSTEIAWDVVLKKVVNELLIDNQMLSSKQAKVILGPNGVGKTHYMAKIIHAHQLIEKDEKFSFIFVNHSNIKTFEEANAFARIFNTKSCYVETLDELNDAYLSLLNDRHIFIEMPGFDFNNQDHNFFIEFIRQNAENIDATLLISCGSSFSMLDRYIQLFKNILINGLSITKCDEWSAFEGIIHSNLKHRIPLRYLSNGSDLLSFIEPVSKQYIYKNLTLPYTGAFEACQSQTA